MDPPRNLPIVVVECSKLEEWQELRIHPPSGPHRQSPFSSKQRVKTRTREPTFSALSPSWPSWERGGGGRKEREEEKKEEEEAAAAAAVYLDGGGLSCGNLRWRQWLKSAAAQVLVLLIFFFPPPSSFPPFLFLSVSLSHFFLTRRSLKGL